MRRIILRIALVIDVLVIVGLLVLLGRRILLVPEKEAVSPGVSVEQETAGLSSLETSTTPPVSGKEIRKRNIRFKQWAPQAKKVEIVGDFNNWIPEVMAKGENQHWMIDYQLEPGEYTYKFCVDGKLKKDPYNKRSVPDGYGGESSLLIVKPLGEK